MEIPVFGIEDQSTSPDSGLSYTINTIYDEPPLHTHTYYEFFVVTEGSALHLVNDSVQTIRKGDFFFIRPSDVHCYNFYHSENFHKLNLGFTQQIFRSVSLFFDNTEKLSLLTSPEFPPSVHLDRSRLERVVALMKEAGDYLQSASPLHTKYHVQCILAIFFEEYFFEYDAELPQKIPSWLTGLMTEMQKLENMQEGYPGMCRLAPCSPNHLCRTMKHYFGVTPTQYVNEQRLNYSVYLLMQTDMDILDICGACGFSNLSHFYHLFRRKFSCPPLQFRKDREKACTSA